VTIPLEDRHDARCTVVTSQVPVENWHDYQHFQHATTIGAQGDDFHYWVFRRRAP
jgi:hypothetical protein